MKESKTTIVLGASNNPNRYGYIAVHRLLAYKHPVIAVGIKKGEVGRLPILNEWPIGEKVDTVTLYLNPTNQKSYYQKIIDLRPQRVIFNPGTENPEFEDALEKAGIVPVEACTLVMLATGQY